MVRAPCCEKMGLKKGPWSSQEDHILISYIQRHGHGNWRALPKHAGLLRCGKSCRLRWVNYLRPDLKRGNFSREEEETIIKLHELLGNRWSAIAARLPGRTDNEIKNVWHTHLKKRVKQSGHNVVVHQETSEQPQDEPGDQVLVSSSEKNDNTNEDYGPISPHQSSSIISDISLPVYSNYCDNSTNISDNNINNNASTMADYSPGNSIYEVDDNFWSEAFSSETYFSSISDYQELLHFPLETSSYNYEQNNIDDIWNFCSTA